MKEKVKKFWLVMPAVVLPFAVFFCWAIGIVGGPEVSAQERKGRFNLSLPIAIPSKDSAWNKMNFYEQAERDSIKRRLMMKQDPLFQVEHVGRDTVDSNTVRVNKRLDQINAMIDERARVDRSSRSVGTSRGSMPVAPAPRVAASGRDVDRLERMMQMMTDKDQDDEQMRQLQSVMDKMLQLQKGDRSSLKPGDECADSTSKFELPLRVYTREETDITSVYTSNRFYGLDDVLSVADSMKNEAVLAEIESDQRVVDGQSIRLRLMQNIFIAGRRVPENNVIVGVAKFRGDRLLVTISSIIDRQKILPVSLSVYAMDGVEGIPIQQTATPQAAGQMVDRSLQGVNVNSFDAALLAQAGNAAMQATKGLLKKRQRQRRIQLAAGFPILLINTKSHSL
jgi:conjugative transposon TraM protein